MAPVLPHGAPGIGARDARSSGVPFRRAVTLMLMTLVLPGSAQLVAGRKQTGRIALRIWLGVVATTALLFGIGMVFGSFVFWFLSNTFVLGLVRIVLMVMAVGWAYLFVDAWRLGEPLALRQKHRLAMVGINGVLCFSVVGSLLFASHVVGVQKDFMGAMFTDGVASDAHEGRYNVLLLGGDSGSGRVGLRPDSLSVASIDAETGETVLFGLPRNMLDFPFPKGSIMEEQFPDGYNCGPECELNSLSTWAQDHEALFKGVDNPGVEATRQGVEGITGLKINYYAMVNMQGFRKLVDAVGGVTLNVRDAIPIGGGNDHITRYVQPGKRKLDGFETLWFARSRIAADDYSRMARQKCVMNAMLHQLSPQKVVLKFEEIADASEALITTDLPQGEVGRFMELVLKARSKPVRSVSFVPPLISTGDPDIDKIHSIVERTIDRSEGTLPKKPKKKAAASGSGASGQAPASNGTTGGSIGNLRDGYAANQAEDLSDAC